MAFGRCATDLGRFHGGGTPIILESFQLHTKMEKVRLVQFNLIIKCSKTYTSSIKLTSNEQIEQYL